MLKTFTIFLLFASISLQCEDLGQPGECVFLLSQKENRCDKLSTKDLAKCFRTCGVCKQLSGSLGSPSNPPRWAQAPPTARTPPTRRLKPDKDEEDPLSLPLYAVIIMVIAALVIFVGATVCVLKLRKKWKKRKIEKNRILLRNAPLPNNTLQPNYMWGSGSHNSGFNHGMDGWARNTYLPVDTGTWHQQQETLNNNPLEASRPVAKNINIVKNGTSDKRRAPDPPPESAYQNLESSVRKSMPSALTGQAKTSDNVETAGISAEQRDGGASRPGQGQSSVNRRESEENQGGGDPPALPARPHESLKTKNKQEGETSPVKSNEDRRNILQYEEFDRKPVVVDADEDAEVDSDSSTIHLTRSMSSTTETTHHASPDLANILNEWKEHLLEQKQELEEYYKSLARYVKCLGLKPITESTRPNDRITTEPLRSNHSERLAKVRQTQPMEQKHASMLENYGQMTFPEPPESVRGDFIWEPHDVDSQKQVINGLKKKLIRIQNLLESTQEASGSGQIYSEYDILNHGSTQSDTGMKESVYYNDTGMLTIKTLIQRLENRERVKAQVRIAQALDTSKKRGGMDISPRDGPITCLSKQVHHVMTDILDPRTCTKIALGAQASFTLANKLIRKVHADLLPVLPRGERKENVAKTVDRVALFTKQLSDMSKQLVARQSSFHSKDYEVFVNAFVDTAQKIMDATFHLVCVIVDLQRAERSNLTQRTTSHPMHRKDLINLSIPPLSNPRQQPRIGKDQLLSRLHSESNATSLSVADVRQLNDDLAKLRKLLNTDTHLTITGGADSPPPYEELPDNRTPMYRESPQGSDCDTESTMSCSTCMPREEESFFEYDHHMRGLPVLRSASDNAKQQKSIQYTTVVIDEEAFRPSTRPPKTPKSSAATRLDTQKHAKRAINQIQRTESGSTEKNESRTRALDPSSFASLHAENPHNDDVQPRHQAMLARYFGTEDQHHVRTHESTAEHPISDGANRNSLLADASTLALHVAENKSEVPTVTMLPCGIVANDTPPMTDPPKERRIRMPKIPTITVLRNGSGGTEEEYHPDDDESDTNNQEDAKDILEPNEQTRESNEYLNDEYCYSDTLPMKDAKSWPKEARTYPNSLPVNQIEENAVESCDDIDDLPDFELCGIEEKDAERRGSADADDLPENSCRIPETTGEPRESADAGDLSDLDVCGTVEKDVELKENSATDEVKESDFPVDGQRMHSMNSTDDNTDDDSNLHDTCAQDLKKSSFPDDGDRMHSINSTDEDTDDNTVLHDTDPPSLDSFEYHELGDLSQTEDINGTQQENYIVPNLTISEEAAVSEDDGQAQDNIAELVGETAVSPRNNTPTKIQESDFLKENVTSISDNATCSDKEEEPAEPANTTDDTSELQSPSVEKDKESRKSIFDNATYSDKEEEPVEAANATDDASELQSPSVEKDKESTNYAGEDRDDREEFALSSARPHGEDHQWQE